MGKYFQIFSLYCFLAFCLVLTPVYAKSKPKSISQLPTPQYYKLANYKLHPSSESRSPISLKQVTDATYFNQERSDVMRVEIVRLNREIRQLRSQIREMDAELERFKTRFYRQF